MSDSTPTAALPPCPGSTAATQQTPPPRDFQELIRPGGFVEDALTRAASTSAFARHAFKARKVQEGARIDLCDLRADPTSTVARMSNIHRPEPVLRLCLALLTEDDRHREAWFEEGWEVYVQNKDAYDAAFADLIPTYFQQAVQQDLEDHARHQAYLTDANRTAADDWDTYIECLQKRRSTNAGGITTGLPALDQALGGGLSGLTFLGGGPGLGKSALVTSVALAALRQHPDLAVLLFNLDMAKSIVYDRILAFESGLHHRRLSAADLTKVEMQAIADANERLKDQCLKRLRVLHEAPRDVYTVNMAVNELKAISGATRTLVIIDYLQLITPPASDEGTPGPQEADHYRVSLLRGAHDYTCTADCPDGYPSS